MHKCQSPDTTYSCKLRLAYILSAVNMWAKSVVGVPMAVALLLACATALLLLLKGFNNWYFNLPLELGKGVKLPPGDMGFPLLGEMRDFFRCFKSRPDDFIRKRIANFGRVGVFKSHLFGRKSILTVSPEFMKFVLLDDNTFPIWFPGSAKMYGLRAINVVRGEEHIRLRKHVTNSLSSPRAVKNGIPLFTKVIKSTLQEWSEQGTVTLESATKEMVMNIMITTFMGLELPRERIRWLIGLLDIYMAGIRREAIYFPGTAHYKAVQAKNTLAAFNLAEIRKRRCNKGSEREDFLQEMMACKDDQGLKLCDEEISDNMVTFLLGGFRSTAYLSMWLAVFVARDPKMLERLREEHLRIRNSKGDGELLTVSDINQLATYTTNVTNEALRLVSIAPFSFRQAVKDVDYKGYRFPKGWQILPWFRAVHMDPINYHEPEAFNPDRWETSEGQNALYSGAFLAFGAGSRKCPGNSYVRITTTIFLHYLTLDYEWENRNPLERGINYLPQPRPFDDGLICIKPR